MDTQTAQNKPAEPITESRFYMWRAVFAMAHVDGFLALEEQEQLYKYLETINFSKEQAGILREDVATAQPVDDMFAKITLYADKREFFELARALVWCDGDLDAQEALILEHLKGVANINEVKTELKESRKTQLIEKLHDVFSKAGLGGVAKKY